MSTAETFDFYVFDLFGLCISNGKIMSNSSLITNLSKHYAFDLEAGVCLSASHTFKHFPALTPCLLASLIIKIASISVCLILVVGKVLGKSLRDRTH